MKKLIAVCSGTAIGIIAAVIGCGKGLNDYSSGGSFAERIAVTTTQLAANTARKPIQDWFIKSAYASSDISFPSFTFSPEDALGSAACSQLDYYINGTSETKIMPISDVTTPKLVVGETYHFYMKTTFPSMTSVPGKFTCESQGCRGEAKAAAGCQFYGVTVSGTWTFSLSCSDVEILSQTTKGDVFLRANAVTSACTLTANGKALADSGSGTKDISKTVTFDVVTADSSAPSIATIEFDGKVLPLGEQVKMNFDKLDRQYSCGQTAPGFTTSACSGSNSGGSLTYTTFKALGTNLSTAGWAVTTGGLGTFGYTSTEYYWSAGSLPKGVPVGLIVTAIDSRNAMVQTKAALYPND
jgi:hypothetical protein